MARFFGGGGGAAVTSSSMARFLLGAGTSSKNFLGFRVRWPRPPASVTAMSSSMSMTRFFGTARRRAGRLSGPGSAAVDSAGAVFGSAGGVVGNAGGADGTDGPAVSVPGDRAAAVTTASTPSGPIFNVGLVLLDRLAGFFSSFSVTSGSRSAASPCHFTKASSAFLIAERSSSVVMDFGSFRASISAEACWAIVLAFESFRASTSAEACWAIVVTFGSFRASISAEARRTISPAMSVICRRIER